MMEIPFCSAFVTFLWIYAFFSVKFSDLKMRECKNKYQVCNVHCRSPLGGFFFPSTTHRLVCRHYLASPPLWALLANGWDSSDCYHHEIISNGKLKISTLEFLKCQSGGEFSLAIISSLRSWQGRRHSFESMPDCQRHIWLKLFHNFARAPRFSTEIDWWRSSESGLGCTLQISQWNLINSVKWMERLSEVLEMQSTSQDSN